MFDWFRKKPKLTREEDRIYLRRELADKALLQDALTLARTPGQPRAVVIAAFFPTSLERLGRALLEASAAENLTDHEPGARGPVAGRVTLLDLTRLVTEFGHRSGLGGVSAWILVAEHHPHPAPERALGTLLEELSATQPLTLRYYGALDDGLFEVFVSERMTRLVQAMGAPEDECLSHGMITKAVQNAQAKIAQRLPHSLPAESEAEWFQKNRW